MAEDIRQAFVGIWSHKMRSLLTMLGIIIGIASIISIVSTIKGTNEQIKQNLIGAGNNNVDVKLTQGGSDYDLSWNGIPDNILPLTDAVIKKVKDIDGVVNATFYNSREYADSITYENNSLDSGSVYGVDQDYLSTKGYQLKSGRCFNQKDYDEYRKVVLVDETVSQSLFPGEDPIGKIIEIQGEPFTVIGTFGQDASFEPVINSISDYETYYQSSEGMLLMPRSTWPVVYKYDEPVNCAVMADTTDHMTKIGKQVETVMKELVVSSSGSSDDSSIVTYSATDLMQTVKNLQEVSQSSSVQLIWIAGISLLVGGIGVMNIMLVTVTERTTEIGLKMAIGARRRRILRQFLTEAAVLTSLGGLLGVVAGIILSKVISAVSGTPSAISVGAGLLAVGFSMIIGIVFGLLPSVKAAHLNPIEALRRE